MKNVQPFQEEGGLRYEFEPINRLGILRSSCSPPPLSAIVRIAGLSDTLTMASISGKRPCSLNEKNNYETCYSMSCNFCPNRSIDQTSLTAASFQNIEYTISDRVHPYGCFRSLNVNSALDDNALKPADRTCRRLRFHLSFDIRKLN